MKTTKQKEEPPCDLPTMRAVLWDGKRRMRLLRDLTAHLSDCPLIQRGWLDKGRTTRTPEAMQMKRDREEQEKSESLSEKWIEQVKQFCRVQLDDRRGWRVTEESLRKYRRDEKKDRRKGYPVIRDKLHRPRLVPRESLHVYVQVLSCTTYFGRRAEKTRRATFNNLFSKRRTEECETKR